MKKRSASDYRSALGYLVASMGYGPPWLVEQLVPMVDKLEAELWRVSREGYVLWLADIEADMGAEWESKHADKARRYAKKTSKAGA